MFVVNDKNISGINGKKMKGEVEYIKVIRIIYLVKRDIIVVFVY